MNKGAVAVLIVTALVFGGVGFVIGQVVNAVTVMPGSSNDPLVSQSYVDDLVGQKTLELQTQLEDLQSYVINGGSGAAPVDNTPSGGDTNTDANTGDNGDNTGSNTSVKVTSSTINIRSSASTSASVVDTADAGTVLTYLGETTASDGVWYHVRLSNGKEGWAASWVCGDPY